MFHANLFARLLRLIAPVPRLICSVHTISEAGLLRMRLYRSTDALADVTTMVSREVAQRYVGSGAVTVHKALVAHNGIDCDAFRFDPLLRAATRAAMGAAPHIRVLLAAGRICEDKDYPNLLHAFAAVTQRHADCVLWIAGDGPGKPALEAMARGLGVAGRVRFLGMRRDMQALMNAADVFVMSSCVEGFPLVIGEAMACERPVVSTAASGVHEWLGCCGAIAPMRDSMALAGAVSQALEHDAATLQRQGQAQRRRILERYSLEATVLRWEAIYRGDFGAVSS
jgi:glycosyltransferase involved in cell wall biosynthesis